MKPDLKLWQKTVWRRRIEAENVRMYRDITGDAKPLHFEEAYAKGTTFGRLSQYGASRCGSPPGGRAKELSRSPVAFALADPAEFRVA
jgi:hypothetical protein